MPDAVSCRVAEFETAILGRPVATLDVDPSAAPDVVATGLAAVLVDGPPAWLVSTRIPTEAVALGSLLLSHGFRAIEELVTLRRPWAPTAMPDGARRVDPADVPECERVARVAFHSDRFHVDPCVDDALADDLKAAWAGNDARGRAEVGVVVDGPRGIEGFNLCLVRGDELVIDLIAVDPDSQGRGVGRALVAGALAAAPPGIRTVTVGTQATNAASLALYRATGFEPVRSSTTFHLVSGCP